MPQPKVIIIEQDGQLGVVPNTSGRLLAVVGCSSSGTVNQPSSFSSTSDLASTFTRGRLPEAAALAIQLGKPVLAVRAAAAASDFGSFGTPYNAVSAGTGTWSFTAPDSGHTIADDYQLVLTVTTGGTLGTGPINFKYSLDGGNTYSAIVGLATALKYAIPNTGIEVVFGTSTQTVIAGDGFTVQCTAPNFDSTTIGAALDALAASQIDWEIVEIAGPLDATLAAAVEAKLTSMRSKESRHSWIGHVRSQTIDGTPETAAEYIDSISTAFDSFVTTQGGLSAGDGYVTSALTGRQDRRPLGWIYAPLTAVQSEEGDVADTNLGALPFRIFDVNQNPEIGTYNETLNPGLSDAGFVSARTFNGGPKGVYVNLPLLKSAGASDFDIHPKRRVIDLAEDTEYQFFVRRLNQGVVVDKSTGKLLEKTRAAMQAAAQKILESVMLAKPKASDVKVVVSGQDNILTTKAITVTLAVTPLAYPETFIITAKFVNPALQITQV